MVVLLQVVLDAPTRCRGAFHQSVRDPGGRTL